METGLELADHLSYTRTFQEHVDNLEDLESHTDQDTPPLPEEVFYRAIEMENQIVVSWKLALSQ